VSKREGASGSGVLATFVAPLLGYAEVIAAKYILFCLWLLIFQIFVAGFSFMNQNRFRLRIDQSRQISKDIIYDRLKQSLHLSISSSRRLLLGSIFALPVRFDISITLQTESLLIFM